MQVGEKEVGSLLQRTTLGELIEIAIRAQNAGAGTPAAANVFQREGEIWTLSFAGKTVRARDRLGLRYMAHLLERPRQTVPVMTLYLAVAGAPRPAGNGEPESWAEYSTSASACPRDTLADAAALSDCRRRLNDLEDELREARSDGDEARRAALEAERGQIQQYLRSCTGRGGRLRKVADTRERVRKAVSNAIARAVAAVFKQHEPLGRHLRNSIRTGYQATYDPETPVRWIL